MTGLNVGGAITPVLFGLLLDHGAPQMVFLLMAAFALAVIGIVVAGAVGDHRPGRQAARAAGPAE